MELNNKNALEGSGQKAENNKTHNTPIYRTRYKWDLGLWPQDIRRIVRKLNLPPEDEFKNSAKKS